MPYPYKIFSKKNSDEKIFCYCRYCKDKRARIIYEFKENAWVFKTARSEHDHDEDIMKGRLKKKYIEEVKNFMEGIDQRK